MKLRALRAEDIFPAVKILSALGLQEVQGLLAGMDLQSEGKDEKAMHALGLKVALSLASHVMQNLHKAERDIFRLLSRLTGEDEKAIREMPPAEFISLLQALFTSEGALDFGRAVLQLLGREQTTA